jgi:hypothetical protein
MANTRSDFFTQLLARPMGFNSIGSAGAVKRYRRGQVATTASEGAGHLYPVLRVSAFDRILKLEISNTADAGLTDLIIGAYVAGDWSVADQSLAASTADRLVDGANRAAATTVPVNVYGTGTNAFGEALQGKPLWEQLGIASAPAPGTVYDLVIQSVGDPAGGATLVVECEYIGND